ncbi:amino acid adenylation domain-containing protein [Streptomyces sp. OF3]|uniref:Amino acid adenylation domain-containing protein n=1 Tax=Streptomyces alkaliterrae TaxID=2213162 RepID=A0A7W3WIN6_9ACTN|nr:non-ribosomal peptide synthetase [Streptomyces alkaliterrae]MBB1253071.1 amino acid adenylation domain-containing protein [Streptomyces alkaliterrae]
MTVTSAALTHWRTVLDGLEPLDPPTDRPRPATPDRSTSHLTLTVPATTADTVRKTAAEHGVALPVALLTGYLTLLGRWARRHDVAVGVPADGDLLVLRDCLTDDDPTPLDTSDDAHRLTFGRLLTRVDATWAAARDHAVPFTRLAELTPSHERPSDRHPLVQALFGADGKGAGQERPTEEWRTGAGPCPPDLALSWADEPRTGLRLRLDYPTALFDAATAERLLQTLLALLAAACERPATPLSALDPLTDEQRAELRTWGGNPAHYPTGTTLLDLIAAQTEQNPEATALVFGDEEVTYRDLDLRANRLAHRLRADHGVGPDVPVAVCLERGTELVVALLAVLKAGGAYVPLDPEHPVERLSFVLTDTAAPVVVTRESLRARLAGAGRSLVAVDTDRAAIEAAGDDSPPRGAGPDHLAYVLHTSGSTGTPKGVAVTVGALVNLLLGMRDTFPAPATERVLFATSATFDIAGVELFLPLITGGRIIGADHEQVHNPRALAALVDHHAVTLAQLTPSAWRPLLDAFDARDGDRRSARELTVFTAGEALPTDLAARMLRLGRRVVNGYGPTETTVYATVAEIRDPEGPVPIGRPTPNTTLRVVDDNGLPVPVGVPGELLVGGAGVARGYLGRPDLTAERFIELTPDPLAPDTGVLGTAGGPGGGRGAGRHYRTGDLVRWLPDGQLEYLGRLDQQVKLRGFRVEPGEIESVLAAHEDVADCAVSLRDDAVPGERVLVAYCVPAADRDLEVSALREWCGRTLPNYMVPGAYVFLDRLPLTAGGKTDRRALPAPGDHRAGPAVRFVGPRNAAERAVARAWAEALWADEVGALDDFFELGGDSLIATRVALRLQEEFGLEIPVRVLFARTTVESLAKALMTARRTGDWPAD